MVRTRARSTRGTPSAVRRPAPDGATRSARCRCGRSRSPCAHVVVPPRKSYSISDAGNVAKSPQPSVERQRRAARRRSRRRRTPVGTGHRRSAPAARSSPPVRSWRARYWTVPSGSVGSRERGATRSRIRIARSDQLAASTGALGPARAPATGAAHRFRGRPRRSAISAQTVRPSRPEIVDHRVVCSSSMRWRCSPSSACAGRGSRTMSIVASGLHGDDHQHLATTAAPTALAAPAYPDEMLGDERHHLRVLDARLRAFALATNRVAHRGDPLHIGGETELEHQHTEHRVPPTDRWSPHRHRTLPATDRR